MTLDAIFSPNSIAVIGASRREGGVGHAVFKNLLGSSYTGTLYPINPNATNIMGVRCYSSILEVPDPVDLAIIIVPAGSATATLQQCVEKGVKGAVVLSAGFKEIGAEGAKLEQGLAALAREHQVPLVGPNCLGVINTDPAVLMNASFSRSMPECGRIAFISQSGALCTAVLDYAKEAHVGFSKFISMGNKAQVTELELLDYLGRDLHTDLILMYLEDLAKPREFIELCRRITGDDGPGKPILAIKSGRTVQGARAASSHTGSLAGADEVYTAIFAQSGILRVESVEELFDYAKAFAARRFPRRNRVAIVTNAGGPGIITTDACVRHGLTMATLSPKTAHALKPVLPATASTANPVDVIGDARHDRYEAALRAVLRDPGVDGVIVILTPQAMTDIEEIATVTGRLGTKSRKPVLASFMGVVDVSGGVRILEQWGIPHYRFPESAAKAFAAMAQYAAWVGRPRTEVRTFDVRRDDARRIFRNAQAAKQPHLTDLEATAVLSAYGFPTIPATLCRTPAEAAHAADRAGYPVVLKIHSPDILHKIDVGGVILDAKSRAQVERHTEQLLLTIKRRAPAAKILGVTVQPMAPPGREVILGLEQDRQFGPLLMFGLGGTYVEVMKDVTFRVAPIRPLGARNMIQSIRAYPILQGVRGEPPADLASLEECLERLSQLAMECPEVAELDINPLRVYAKGHGCAVLDARIVLAKNDR